MNDFDLLREYSINRSESAFNAIVQRYAPMVRAAAARQTGDPSIADDITQAVFIILARKAATLSKNTILSGWLYKTTRLVATDFLKSRHRREKRENEALNMNQHHEPAELEGVIDEAMMTLPDADRNALLLRFSEGQSFATIAERLNVREDAVRKRVERALERLRRALQKSGVITSCAALTAWFIEGFQPASAALQVSTLASTATLGSATLRLADQSLRTLATQQFKIVLSSLAALAAIGTATVIHVKGQAEPIGIPQPAHIREQVQSLASAPAPLPFAWAQVESPDFKTYMENLRAIGCPEPTIRNLMIATISRKYNERILAIRERFQTRTHSVHRGDPDGRQMRAELKHLQQEKRDDVRDVLGPDGTRDLDLLSGEYGAELTYYWLPKEKREKVGEIENRYQDLLNAAGRQSALFRIPAEESAESDRLLELKNHELAQVLSEGERKESELLNTGIGLNIRLNQFFRPTDSEVIPLYDAEKAWSGIGQFAGETPEDKTARLAKIEEVNQQLIAAIGEDRYRDYALAKNPLWKDAFGFAQRFDLSDETRDQVFETLNEFQNGIKDLPDSKVPSQLKEQVNHQLSDLLGPDLYKRFLQGGSFWQKQQLRNP